jgi:hypothetical protein
MNSELPVALCVAPGDVARQQAAVGHFFVAPVYSAAHASWKTQQKNDEEIKKHTHTKRRLLPRTFQNGLWITETTSGKICATKFRRMLVVSISLSRSHGL